MAIIPTSSKMFDFKRKPSGVDLMKPVNPVAATAQKPLTASLQKSSVLEKAKKQSGADPVSKKLPGNILEMALGGAQALGGIVSDLSNKKPKPVEDSTSPLLNTLALETKNAANSTASRMMEVATGRADRDFAANMAEARRSGGGNAALSLMAGVQSQEQGKEAVVKASVDAASVIMQANRDAAQLTAQGAQSGLQAKLFNAQMENEQYMSKKNASADLIGTGLENLIGSIETDRYKKEQKRIIDENKFSYGKKK